MSEAKQIIFPSMCNRKTDDSILILHTLKFSLNDYNSCHMLSLKCAR